MLSRRRLLALLLGGAFSASVVGCSGGGDADTIELLNVSYDPTRELWKDLNQAFIAQHARDTGKKLNIRQSHASSGSQARAVIDGLEADVVTLALWSDTDAIARKDLIEKGWEKRLPNNSVPYESTIVFVVRKGNPKGIKDWPDLVTGDVKIITPSPKTSGNGKLSFLAAWGAVIQKGGSEADAKAYITELYRRVPVLDAGARGSTTTFSQKKIGDVHLTWENEAHLEIQEASGELEIVYPPVSIKADPPIAVVDANAKRKGTAEVAEAYLKFLYTPEGQEIIAKHHYRPINEEIRKKHPELPDIKLFALTSFSKGWDDAQARFFAEGAIFDEIFKQRSN